MGYFSSATDEDTDYKRKYCNKCIHDVNDDCPVWFLHRRFSSQHSERLVVRFMLDGLIPMSYNGVWNKQCKMYVEKYELAK